MDMTIIKKFSFLKTVKSVIDDIESDVNEIRDLLDDIKGLTEIDEIKDKISSLSQKLY